MMPSFQFDGYTLRPAEGDADRVLAAAWMEEDPWHRGQFAPEFWLEQSATVNSFVLEDMAGPVFFFQAREIATMQAFRDILSPNGVEIFIQFAPKMQGMNRLRTVQALSRGFAWMHKRLSSLGNDAVYFTSRNPQLIEFAQRHLGFVIDATMPFALPQGFRLKAYLERRSSDGEVDDSKAQELAR